MKIGLVYGSTSGSTHAAAEKVASQLGGLFDEVVQIASIDVAALASFDVLVIGTSTWNVGELQEDWHEVFDDLADVRFDGKLVLFFGCGDQRGYPDNFLDAMGILRARFVELGALCDMGHWPTEGYDFTASKAVVDGRFVGLALDEDNQPDLTDLRVAEWCAQVKREFGLTVEG